MAVHIDTQGYIGAGIASVAAELADAKLRRLTTQLSNGDLAAAAAIALQAFDMFPGYAEYIDGAAEWAVGQLVGSIARRYIMPAPAPLPAPQPTAPAAPAATAPAPVATGVSGVPASGGSAAFDLPTPGY